MTSTRSERPANALSVLWTGAQPTPNVAPDYKWRVLAVLSVVSLVAYMDRYILAVLLVPIKAELHASDTGMGMLVGVAFFGVYALAAVPLSRVADKSSRRNLLALAVAFWSIATCLCGAVTSFFQMFIARVAVAAGEAGCAPTNMSLLGDLFPRTQRAIASGGLFAGTAIGIAFGVYIGGMLNDLVGWRWAFVLVGAPGLLLALFIWLTIYEPKRGGFDGGLKAEFENQPFLQALGFLFGIRTYVWLILANGFIYLGVQGSMVWMPAFLMRVHNMSTTTMGIYFGLSVGVGILAGNILGGLLGDRLGRLGGRWYLYAAGASALLGAPLLSAFAYAGAPMMAVAAIPLFAFVTALATPTNGAMMLNILPPRHRGLGAAIALFFVNGVGNGIGPLIIGMMSDAFEPAFGEQSLRYAFYVMPAALLISALFFFIASASAERDMARAVAVPTAVAT